MIVVVPSRGLPAMLRICLEALQRALSNLGKRPETHVLVIDNASEVPLWHRDIGPHSVMARFDQHKSFSYCVNYAASSYPGHDLLLLNNDVILHPRTVGEMMELLPRHLVGAVGTRLVYPAGTIQHAGVYQSIDGPQHVGRHQPTESVSRVATFPTAVTGATMLLSRTVFDHVGGFDETYDFGSEDIDYCHRLALAGYRVACNQASDSLHFESMTPGRTALDVPSRATYLSKWFERVSRET